MLQQPSNEFQIAIKALGYLRTHWWVFVMEVAIVYGYSLLRFYRTPSVYESHCTLLIDTSRRQLYQSVMLGTQKKDDARKQNMVHLMTSQDVLERFRSLFMEYYNTEGRPSHLRSYFPNGIAHSTDFFRNRISLHWDRNSDIYNIRCSSENQDAAHDLCLIFMNTAQNYYPDIGQREASFKREFLGRQIASLSRQIAERELAIAEFQKDNDELMTFILLNPQGEGIQRLRLEFIALKQKMNQNRTIKRLLSRTPASTNIQEQSYSQTTGALTSRLAEIQFKRFLTQQSPTSDQRDRLKQLDQEIELLLAQLEKFKKMQDDARAKNPITIEDMRSRINTLELDYQLDLYRKVALEEEMQEIQNMEKNVTQKRLELQRIKAELDHKQTLLNNLFQKEQEMELEMSAGNSEIFRLQEPSRSGHRISPQLSKHLVGSLSICIFLLLLTTVLLMTFFPRLDSEMEATRLNLPILGKIPVIKGRASQSPDSMSPFVMEYLKIMNYRILRETKELKCPVVVITSPQTGEGKSTVTYFMNLAAQSPKRKNLFIDGDLLTVHPNVFFGIKEDHSPGLKALLEDPNADIQKLIVSTIHNGLYFLPRGGRTETIASPHFLRPLDKFFKILRDEYDMIFIDTPPLFASNLTHQWSSLADLVVLIARIWVTRPKEIIDALQTCKIFSKAPVGIALNCIPMSSQQRRASNYYFSRRKARQTDFSKVTGLKQAG